MKRQLVTCLLWILNIPHLLIIFFFRPDVVLCEILTFILYFIGINICVTNKFNSSTTTKRKEKKNIILFCKLISLIKTNEYFFLLFFLLNINFSLPQLLRSNIYIFIQDDKWKKKVKKKTCFWMILYIYACRSILIFKKI